MVKYVRVALGTAAVLGFCKVKIEVAPTTAHLLVYSESKCLANCMFCPQARESLADGEMLSRVEWPRFSLDDVIEALQKSTHAFKRVCLQSVNYPGVADDLIEIVASIKKACDLPLSVACHPISPKDIKRLTDAGVERMGIALDAATPELFEKIKGKGAKSPYRWETHLKALEEAKKLIGRATTHLVVGLGESEEEMIRTIQMLYDRGITVGLFAFTPVKGTPLEKWPRPKVSSYRKIQMARHLIASGIARADDMKFQGGRLDDFGVNGDTLVLAADSGIPFMTSGCPNCNRPFYNESPLGPIYNFPRKPTKEEIESIKKELGLAGK
ncbi:biotin synthase-related enzyme [Acetomicrobium mobile DSM 13181]|uniref:Biotin synthase-related enzyme n=1 Tax=Acetomicrobium mobile (strain ATCC BAA-54 / DSM 13181 / JCM 12221 / NGA) TaxID=891968 RepID=I4BWS6_ACEMN|nr:radical SAM protein [Acetomicrobium mobile]AFM21733.1 biotin synthase-related enzyme [Acetomicrobium mobile DSM 13181]